MEKGDDQEQLLPRVHHWYNIPAERHERLQQVLLYVRKVGVRDNIV